MALKISADSGVVREAGHLGLTGAVFNRSVHPDRRLPKQLSEEVLKQIRRSGFPIGAGDPHKRGFRGNFAENASGGDSKRFSRIVYLHPGRRAVGLRVFGHNCRRALMHRLGDKPVAVHGKAGNAHIKRSGADQSGIEGHVRNLRIALAAAGDKGNPCNQFTQTHYAPCACFDQFRAISSNEQLSVQASAWRADAPHAGDCFQTVPAPITNGVSPLRLSALTASRRSLPTHLGTMTSECIFASPAFGQVYRPFFCRRPASVRPWGFGKQWSRFFPR